MSATRISLQTIDINVLPVPSKCLHKPRAAGECRSVSSPALCGPLSSPLSPAAVSRHLRDALLSVELLRSGSAAERRALLHAELTRVLTAASSSSSSSSSSAPAAFSSSSFSSSAAAGDDDVRVALAAACAAWGDGGAAPLSFRVLELAKRRRRALCGGFARGLSDLKEWLRLALLLDEPRLPHCARRYARGLAPAARQRVEDAALLHGADSAALARAILEAPSAEEGETPLDARYFAFALDDLIARADAEPVAQAPRDGSAQLREPLSEWLLQVSLALNLHIETFFLAIVILDRYMDRIAVGRADLQLAACAALLLASKQEEVLSIALRSLVRYGGDRFTVDELVSVECKMLAVLDFNVVCVTLHAVGTGIAMEQEPVACERQRSFLLYTLATLAIRTRHGQFRLSALAAAAVYFSRLFFGIPTGDPSAEVRELLPIVLDVMHRNAPSSGVYNIFLRSVFHEVSRIPLPDTI